MRLRAVSGLALLAALTLTPAQSAPADRGEPKAGELAEAGRSLWTERDSEAVRKRDLARQELWDRKMKALTGSVCTGC